jgi:hypothetical protein
MGFASEEEFVYFMDIENPGRLSELIGGLLIGLSTAGRAGPSLRW